MARPLRIEYPGAWYHVMNRGQGKKQIFHSKKDYESFLELLGEISEIYSVEIHAFSLMTNHYHLLIHTPIPGLSRSMRHLNGIYTRIFNQRQHTDGPLFRGRFKSIIVDSDEYLLELLRYIHLNPVKAGLSLHPSKHLWTSHAAYISKLKRPHWLVTKEILSRFGKKENRAITRMNRFVCAGVPKAFEESIQKQRVVLGSDAFKEWLYNNFVKEKKRGIALKDQQIKTRIKAKQILDHVSNAYHVPIDDMRQGEAFRKNEARSMAIYLMRRLMGMPQNKIAHWVKAKNEFTIAKNYQRFHRKLEENKTLRRVTKELSRSIMSNVKP